MKKDEFYIGYAPKAPRRMRLVARMIYIFLFLAVGATALIMAVDDHETFNNHTHEFGDTTSLTGIIRTSPYPLLEIERNGIRKNILLVGFGKKGMEQSLDDRSLVHVTGFLIYGDGHTILQVLSANQLEKPPLAGKVISPTIDAGEVTLRGTIIDPVCYFGVMKPGEGKIHRSCAVRCISGGIPPVFMTTDTTNRHEYFLIDYSEAISKEVILDLVAKPCVIKGKLIRSIDARNPNTYTGWDRIKVESLTQ